MYSNQAVSLTPSFSRYIESLDVILAEIKSLFIKIEQAELESLSQSQFGHLVSFHLVIW